MITHFYSDPHFGHKNIIKFCDRPFSDVKHMERVLISNYNKVVGMCGVTLWVGDCFFLPFNKSKAILDKLNGRKLLVSGNHDRSNARMAEMGFELVTDELVLHMEGKTCRVNHFPYAPSNPDDEHPSDVRFLHLRPEKKTGEVLIHGHTHDKRKVNGNMIHVGVDSWDYAPVPREEVEKLIRDKC